ncbi:MAG: hypothetical protein HFJ09_16245, partial [Lachnospiraceae bacterium]|nr:hypothetical protein [Lachnospiraceae bacterium]
EEQANEEELQYEEITDETGEEEPKQEELEFEEEVYEEEQANEEEFQYEEITDETGEEEPKQEELEFEEEVYEEEQTNEEVTEYEEIEEEEEQTCEGTEHKEKTSKKEIVEEKIQKEETEEEQKEIPAYVQRDRNSVKQDMSQNIEEKTENITGEQKTMNIFRRLLGRREKDNQAGKKDTNIVNTNEKVKVSENSKDKNENKKIADEEEGNNNSKLNKDNRVQGEARVNVVKVKPAAMKDNKKQRKVQLNSTDNDLKNGVTTGVVKRYMGKKTQDTFTEQEANVVYEDKLQEAAKVIEFPEKKEKQESCVSMEDVSNLFPQYQQNLSVCEGILGFLQSVFDGTGARNLIVTSKNPDNAIVLCANMADILCEHGVIENKQPVTILAEELNKMHLEQNYGQVSGRMLHITSAKKITPDTAQSIMNMVEELGNNVIVVLNDGKPYMDDFMNEYKIMQKYFPHWIVF